jgi:hypothetical protein
VRNKSGAQIFRAQQIGLVRNAMKQAIIDLAAAAFARLALRLTRGGDDPRSLEARARACELLLSAAELCEGES